MLKVDEAGLSNRLGLSLSASGFAGLGALKRDEPELASVAGLAAKRLEEVLGFSSLDLSET